MKLKRVLHWTILIIISGWLNCSYAQQKIDIKGVVSDSESGEALPYTNVTVWGTHRGAITNSDGYFVLVNEPVGIITLVVRYLGYHPETVIVHNHPDSSKTLNIKMTPSVIELEGATVTYDAEMLDVSGKDISRITLSPRQLLQLPSVGEVDVFRSLQLLPGITGASDGESGLYVRGGTPDQNLVLFDGMTIYHVDHFFGFFSAFNSDAIKDIQIFKGGFPAEYGGRISSVVNITGKTGHQTRTQIGLGANLLSAHANVEIPLWEKGTFLFAARRSYTDFIRSPLYESIYELMTGDAPPPTSGPGQGPNVQGGPQSGDIQAAQFQPDFYFYDLNSKLTISPTSKDIMTISFYSGKDDLDKSQDFSDMPLQDIESDLEVQLETTDLNKWGNLGISGKWARQWNSRLHTDLLAAHSRYFSTYDKNMVLSALSTLPDDDSTGSNVGFVSASLEDNLVKDITYRLDAVYFASRSHTIKSGLWLSQFHSKYDFILNDTIQLLDRDDKCWLSAFYVQDKWQIGKNEITAGLRFSNYENTGKWYWEPRIAVTVPVNSKFSVKAAWGYYYQYVNRIINENVLEGSRDFWILSDDNLKPSFSEHLIIGTSYETSNWLFSIEGYYKFMDNLFEFSRRFTGRADYADYFFIGEGIAKGIELLVQKKYGKISGWIGYTLGKVEHTFSAFNDGEPFPADNDRRHEINMVAKYSLGRWTFATTGVFATGKAYTAPESQYVLKMLNDELISYIHVGDKNSYRLPEYFRIDLSASRQFEFEAWRMQAGLSIFNITNHKNVWYREYNLQTIPVTVTDALMLGFTPTIYLQINRK
jgi:ferric enterobactin receptor